MSRNLRNRSDVALMLHEAELISTGEEILTRARIINENLERRVYVSIQGDLEALSQPSPLLHADQ
jgi:hypothetical protein